MCERTPPSTHEDEDTLSINDWRYTRVRCGTSSMPGNRGRRGRGRGEGETEDQEEEGKEEEEEEVRGVCGNRFSSGGVPSHSSLTLTPDS